MHTKLDDCEKFQQLLDANVLHAQYHCHWPKYCDAFVPFHAQDDFDQGQVKGPCEDGCSSQAGAINSQHPLQP